MGLFTAIAGIGSAILGSRAAKKQRANAIEDARLALPRLRESAEEAGFNPLTALSNGGLSSFQNLPSGVAPLASQQVLSGIGSALDSHFSSAEKLEEANAEADLDLKKLQIERMKAGGAYPVIQRTFSTGTGYSSPRAKTGGPANLGVRPMGIDAFGGPAELGDNVSAAPPGIGSYGLLPQANPKSGETLNTNPFPVRGGLTRYVDPRNPDAEHAEQRYGDITQEVFGIGNMIDDFSYDTKLQGLAEKYGPDAANWVHAELGKNPRADLEQLILQAKDRWEWEGPQFPKNSAARRNAPRKNTNPTVSKRFFN